MDSNKKLNIKDLAEEDRPREKLLLKGVSSLSDAELLAILIGSGNRNETAVELCQRILHSVSNNLNYLGKLEINDLSQFKGIGEAKAISIIAALELGKRRKVSEVITQPQIASSEDIFQLFQPQLSDLRHEEVWLIHLNHANKVIKTSQISKGGISSSIVDIRMIMKEAINSSATAIILCHNHPSGNTTPSIDDDSLTYKLKEAARVMDIPLLDHIIIGDTSFFSYLDNNKL